MAGEGEAEEAFRGRVRIKQFTSILTTYGYTLAGGSLLEPVTKGTSLHLANVLGAGVALAMQAVALYLAPRGERRDERL